MKKYFIHNGKEQEGPFNIEDLQQKGITSKTMIWYDGISKWTEAQEIPELKEIIIKGPPPLDKPGHLKQTIEKTIRVLEKDPVNEIETKIANRSAKKIFKWLIVTLAIIGLIFLISNLIGISFLGKQNQTGNYSDSLVVINQHGHAYYSNYDQKWDIEIEGDMLNKASVNTYKDFIVEVEFLSETKTLLETKKYTIYQYIKPMEKHHFYAKLDGDAPTGGKYYILNWKLIGATPINENNK